MHRVRSRNVCARSSTFLTFIKNRWVQDDSTEPHAESKVPPITSSREDRHVIRIALMDPAATSRALNQELGSFERQVCTKRSTTFAAA
ncbi:hypothetical protein TNCV_3171051 [Trichonephila clavipes]|nr:hypothetical protein TNCV_3171051 [Trichonephila clavipes]